MSASGAFATTLNVKAMNAVISPESVAFWTLSVTLFISSRVVSSVPLTVVLRHHDIKRKE